MAEENMSLPLDNEMNHEELLKRAYTIGYEYEHKFGNCPQCLVASIQEVLPGIVDDSVFRAGYALAGGGALTGNGTCGALTGGLMVIGAAYGRKREDFEKGRYPYAFKLGKELTDRFTQEFGGVLCCEVQTKLMGRKFNLLDAKDYAAFEAAGGHDDKCTDVLGKVAMWTAEILLKARARIR